MTPSVDWCNRDASNDLALLKWGFNLNVLHQPWDRGIKDLILWIAAVWLPITDPTAALLRQTTGLSVCAVGGSSVSFMDHDQSQSTPCPVL